VRIYSLTPTGDVMASSRSNSGSDAMRVLYWLRRNGKHGTEEQIADQLGMDKMRVRVATNQLMRMEPPAIRVLGGA
jgi:hypothetical protein